MDDDNLMDVNFTDLDLNQEPRDPPLLRVTRYGSMLNDLETAHDRIDDRIRQLEAVTARARQRQRWRDSRNSMEISYFSGEMMVDVGQRGGNNTTSTEQRTAERGKGCKRDSSHLVAKALQMDSDVKKANKESGSFYDCHICLDLAREPVLTCCGHLFCWACFYQVSYIDSTCKECPVCKGEVSDSTVIPIYGNGGSENPVYELESGLKIPPRPRARRVESVRQQHLTRGLSHVPVAEALRRIRISIGEMGNQTQQQEIGGGNNNVDVVSQEGQNAESGRIRIHQVSRVLSESAASLSSLSSALSNAERLVEDLETVINNRFIRNDARALSGDVENPFTRNSNVIQSNHNQVSESNGDINAGLPMTSSSQSNDVSGSIVRVTTMPRASSIRRRSNMSRTTDLESRDSREPRRRRLN
ncbi:hypothetical protein BUALT_Bualt19G0034500 [Buddleja alternifolia]|uniref:E3 ubiquitin-protein ligase RMA n=1 Tax=Buddleja alternifolia TaxID=168488 RepID=A0AAV6W152_9LAMI|nr:hypothetical protein BUALT_Bualt19G0034500 [Buddleja alternifolia]